MLVKPKDGKGLVFMPRLPELLALEGWHQIGDQQAKISCRFKDLLRCSYFPVGKPRHFDSCFRPDSVWHPEQPVRRCQDPSWAIAYVPDVHGNFLGRSFLHLIEKDTLEIGKVYGNKLSQQNLIDYIKMIKFNLNVVPASADTYLPVIAG